MRAFLNIVRCSHLGFLPLAMLAGEASADVYVEFSAVGLMGVPLSPWALGLTGLLLGLLAYSRLNGRGVGNGWPLAVVMVAGVMALVPAKSWLSDAIADAGVTTFDLVFPSPVTSLPVPYWQDIELVNTTGQTIKIDLIGASGGTDWDYLCSPTSQPECQVGTVMTPASTCYVKMCLGT